MAKSVDQLMGYEGNAARIYFRTLGKLIDPELPLQEEIEDLH